MKREYVYTYIYIEGERYAWGASMLVFHNMFVFDNCSCSATWSWRLHYTHLRLSAAWRRCGATALLASPSCESVLRKHFAKVFTKVEYMSKYLYV